MRLFSPTSPSSTKLSPWRRRSLWLGSLLGGMLLGNTALAAPVAIAGDPSAPAPAGNGSGLCISTTAWTRPVNEIPQTTATFTSGMNAYFDANTATRISSVHREPFDLSNNLNDGRTLSFGDFTSAACASLGKVGGCPFAITDATTAFGVRVRGFLRVPPAWLGQKVHFGAYTDDAMSLTIFDSAGASSPVLVRPPQLGFPTFRTTNTATFSKSGLFPIEIVYAQISEHAALEVSTLLGDFTDFERAANQPPIVALKAAGFTLLEPADLFQSEEGTPSFSDLGRCVECDRALAGKPGNGGCASGYHCNAAALCSACVTAASCGASCAPCTGEAPICANEGGVHKCVAAEVDAGTDASSPPPSNDGGPNQEPDASTSEQGSSDDSGCGCRAATSRGGGAAIGFALFGLIVFARRRRLPRASVTR